MNQKAPSFQIPACQGLQIVEISQNDFIGKFLVLLFYPSDFTFVCPTELISFNEKKHEFDKLNAQVLAISTDSIESHLAWLKTERKEGGVGKLNILLASDKNKKMSSAYGVLDSKSGVAYRGLFIIDDAQRLRQIIINDIPIGRNVDEVIRLIQAIQYYDENGEVCPANWRPGKPSIKQDRQAFKDYMKEHTESSSSQ